MPATTYLPLGPLRRELARLAPAELSDRLHAARTLSRLRGLQYIDDDERPKTIELALVPWLLTPAQLARFQQVAADLTDALLRLPALYAAHPAVRQVIPLDDVQESWAQLAHHPRSRPWAVLGRMDSTAVFDRADWDRSFFMLEPNAVGVGGVHYAPTSCGIVLDLLSDVLHRAYPRIRFAPTPDPRELLVEEMALVAKRLRRPLRRIALLENAEFTTGTDEFARLAVALTDAGLPAIVADPRDLVAENGVFKAKGVPVDLLYRDCELTEFVEMEASGRRLTGLRRAITEGRLVSGLSWEFDQKSCWEIFTDPTWERYFTPRQRRLFRDHLPWTRLVRAGRVAGPDGRSVDLTDYIRRHRESLVLKPNTLYGGQGVIVGRAVTQPVWERTLATALRGPQPYVVQSYAPIAQHQFPRLDGKRVANAERRVVSGFFFNSSAIGLVGRFSENPVVNISRGGGLLAALVASS